MRGPGELREAPRGRFPSVLVVLRRFWEVFGGSERVWNGFKWFSKGFRRFLASPGRGPGRQQVKEGRGFQVP